MFDRMIDDIDATEQTTPTEWEKMKQLKDEIIRRTIIAGRGMAQNHYNTVLLEQKKYFIKHNVDESTFEWQVAVINAIESRRLHMIERAAYITQFKLATYFKNN
jgi:hypothetical protein